MSLKRTLLVLGCFALTSGMALSASQNDFEVYFGDYNNDGRTDVLVRKPKESVYLPYEIKVELTNSISTDYVIKQNADGSYSLVTSVSQSQINSTSWMPSDGSFSYQDINGDGLPELVINTADGNTLALSTDGEVISAIAANVTGTGLEGLAFADLNGDGHLEAIKTTEEDSQIKPASTASASSSSIDQLLHTLNGQVGVGGTGAASYSLPIALPEAVGGLVPSLAITYNSQKGRSNLGVGWSLAGFSQINRCKPTLDSDGYNVAAAYSDKERLCLDGQKLKLFSGSYHANGSTYRTELESYAKVEKVSENQFKVWSSDGLISTYADTFLLNAGGKVAVWRLSSVEDRLGNTITYTYNSSPREIYPEKISYGHVDIDIAYRDVLTPSNGLLQQDVHFYPGSGSVVSSTKVVDGVTVRANNNLVDNYSFDYSLSPNSERTRLDTIRHCYNASETQCSKPVDIAWNDSDISFSDRQTVTTINKLDTRQLHLLDIDGDGYRDLMWANNTDWEGIYVSEGQVGDVKVSQNTFAGNTEQYSNLSRPITSGLSGNTNKQTILTPTLDVWGKGSCLINGKVRLVGPAGYNPCEGKDIFVKDFFYWDIQRPQFGSETTFNVVTRNSGDAPIVYDINGDGLTDIVASIPDYWQEFLSNYSKWCRFDEPNHSSCTDVNGKAITERYKNIGDLVVLIRTPNGSDDYFEYFVDDMPEGLSLTEAMPFDYQGDGHMEFLAPIKDSNSNTMSWRIVDIASAGNVDTSRITATFNTVNLPKGAGWSRPYVDPVSGATSSRTVVGNGRLIDINSDGLADFIQKEIVSGTVKWYVHLNEGGMFHSKLDLNINYDVDPDTLGVMDYEGDGRPELIFDMGSSFKVVSFSTSLNSSGSIRIHTKAQSFPSQGGMHFSSAVYQDFRDDKATDLKLSSVKPLFVDFDGNGLTDIVYSKANSLYVYKRNGKQPDLVELIDQGLGRQTTIQYSTLGSQTTHDAYDNYYARNYPYRMVREPLTVVHQLSRPTGVKDSSGTEYQSTDTYTYYGARAHLKGRGFLGFRKVITSNSLSGEATSIIKQRYFPLTGMVRSVEVKKGDKRLSYQWNNWRTVSKESGSNVRYINYLSSSGTETYEASGLIASDSRQSNSQFNSEYGVMESTVDEVRSASGVTAAKMSTVLEDYDKDKDNWLFGFRKQVSTTSERFSTELGTTDTKSSISKNTRYKNSLGQLTTLIGSSTANVGTAHELTSTNGYTSSGVLSSVVTSGSGFTTRADFSHSNFKHGFLPQTEVDALSMSTQVVYDDRFGVPTQYTDANGHVSKILYNIAGMPVAEIAADGTQSRIFRRECASNCPDDAIWAQTTTVTNSKVFGHGAPMVTQYFDVQGRVIKESSTLPDGSVSHIDFEFDQLGRLVKQSLPYTAGSPVYVVFSNFDDLNRPLSIDYPNGTTVSHSYLMSGDYLKHTTITTITESGAANKTQTTSSYYDAAGLLVKTVDAAGTITQFAYDGNGKLKWTRVNEDDKTVIDVVHNLVGLRTSLTDPNTGTTNYSYDALGRMLSQTDSRGKSLTYSYDDLDRIKTEVADGITINYTYDAGNKAKGLLSSIALSNDQYKANFSYDNLSRLASESYELKGQPARSFTYRYDDFSRMVEQDYPSGLKAGYQFSQTGALSGIFNPVNNQTYWALNKVDHFGNITEEAFGNGVVTSKVYDPTSGLVTRVSTSNKVGTALQDLDFKWNSIGHLTERTRNGATESFSYDSLNRLRSSQGVTYQYDALGNITQKSNVSDVDGYKYDHTAHQISQITFAGVTTHYGYDAAGNMTQRGSTQLTYNSVNKPIEIVDGPLKTKFEYGSNWARYYREDLKDKKVKRQTYYLAGGDYEEVYDVSAKETKFKHNFGNGVQLTLTKKDGQAAGSVDVQFMHKDHLGSVDVITDMAGQVVESMAFQPFGDRKQQLSTDLDPNTNLAMATFETTTDGFTGHEMLDDFGLIHMNGRVYDPQIGRFLSADPFVQAPESSQSFNRYSYVMNSPLSLVDPSGYNWLTNSVNTFLGWLGLGAGAASSGSSMDFTSTTYDPTGGIFDHPSSSSSFDDYFIPGSLITNNQGQIYTGQDINYSQNNDPYIRLEDSSGGIGKTESPYVDISYDSYLSEAKQPVQGLEVGKYGDLAPRSVKDGMTPDHIPSIAAIKRHYERELGFKLTDSEARALRNETNCIMISTCTHQSSSRTYGGRNSSSQIESDSLNLGRAVQFDLETLRPNLIRDGYTNEEINTAFDALDSLNRRDGLY